MPLLCKFGEDGLLTQTQTLVCFIYNEATTNKSVIIKPQLYPNRITQSGTNYIGLCNGIQGHKQFQTNKYYHTATLAAEGSPRRLPGRRALVVVFIKNMLFEIIAFVVFECL